MPKQRNATTTTWADAAWESPFIMVYDWENKEEMCYRMYIEEKKSLEDIMDYMKEHHKFAPRYVTFVTLTRDRRRHGGDAAAGCRRAVLCCFFCSLFSSFLLPFLSLHLPPQTSSPVQLHLLVVRASPPPLSYRRPPRGASRPPDLPTSRWC